MSEVLIALGLAGGIALLTADFMKNNAHLNKRSELELNSNIFALNMTKSLLDDGACINTFSGLGNIKTVTALTQLKDKSNNVVHTVGAEYGNTKIFLTAIRVTNVRVEPAVIRPNETGTADLDVTLDITQPKTGNTTSTRMVSKTFPLKMEVNPSFNVIKCHSVVESSVSDSQKISCESIGGVYDYNFESCSLPLYSGGPGDQSVSASKQALLDTKNAIYDTTYVWDNGNQTITGALNDDGARTFNAQQVSASNAVCVSGRCQDFNATNCPAGFYVTGVAANGTVQCSNRDKHERSTTCPTYQILQGYSSAGTPICSSITCQVSLAGTCTHYYACSCGEDCVTTCSYTTPYGSSHVVNYGATVGAPVPSNCVASVSSVSCSPNGAPAPSPTPVPTPTTTPTPTPTPTPSGPPPLSFFTGTPGPVGDTVVVSYIVSDQYSATLSIGFPSDTSQYNNVRIIGTNPSSSSSMICGMGFFLQSPIPVPSPYTNRSVTYSCAHAAATGPNMCFNGLTKFVACSDANVIGEVNVVVQ